MKHNGNVLSAAKTLGTSLLLSVLIASLCLVPGCGSKATVPEAESQKQEAKDLRDAIEEIQKDTSLSARDKECAVQPLRQRLDRIPR